MSSIFDEEFYIPPLKSYSYTFPNPRDASDEGLLAYGGDLSIPRLLSAYRNGIFPWYSEEDPLLWWSPNPRLLLYPEQFKLRKSFKRVLRSGKFKVLFDHNFEEVIKNCSGVYREGQKSSWIVEDIIVAYMDLHYEGYAHSVEVYLDDKLVGGLYGVSLGKAFFGESMFSLVSDASKVAFKALSDVLGAKSYDFIDCQMKTNHLISMGAKEVDRDFFLDCLEKTLLEDTQIGLWQHFKCEYKEQ
jgi:leucyl/phenylalanyl-tRNA--protein transferase